MPCSPNTKEQNEQLMHKAIVALRLCCAAHGTFPPGSFFSISLPSLSRSLRSASAASAPAVSPLASASWTAFQRLYSSLSLRHDSGTMCVGLLADLAQPHDTV